MPKHQDLFTEDYFENEAEGENPYDTVKPKEGVNKPQGSH
jgi:hypothetical protein